jgi:hypothetical protein
MFQAHIDGYGVDDFQLQCVTLRLENGSYFRFQADTGSQCNVIPPDLYMTMFMPIHAFLPSIGLIWGIHYLAVLPASVIPDLKQRCPITGIVVPPYRTCLLPRT